MSGDLTDSAFRQITSITTRLLTTDPKYLYCVANSGVLEFIPRTQESSWLVYGTAFNASSINSRGEDVATAATRVQIEAASVDPNVSLGSCRLACTGSSVSASCCDAADRLLLCKLSGTAVEMSASDKKTLEDMLSLRNQCGPAQPATISLWIATAVAVLVVTVLVIATRRLLARVRARATLPAGDLNEEDGIPVLTPTSKSSWTSLLLSWRQVSNLVWKNLRIKRTKPVAMVLEVLVPIIAMAALVFIVNVSAIFGMDVVLGDADYQQMVEQAVSSYEASKSNAGFLCTHYETLSKKSTYGEPVNMKLTFYSSGQAAISLFFLIVYVKFVSRTTTMMVIEKESRLREIMKIMGLSDMAVVLSWVLTTAAFTAPMSLVIAAMLAFGSVTPQTSYVVVVWLFFLFSQSITAFSYFLTPIFNRSRAAAITSVLAWIVLYVPYFTAHSSSNAIKYAAALSPPAALGFAFDDMLRHARLGKGFSYDAAIVQSPIEVPSAFSMCGMLLLDCVILFALGWYIDQVLPQEHGVPKPWNFLLTKGYWTSATSPKLTTSNDTNTCQSPSHGVTSAYTSVQTPVAAEHTIDLNDLERVGGGNSSDRTALIERASAALNAQERNGTCLQIHKLRKEYETDGSKCVAVDDLTLTMYSGHITALLGHNGAGKTTVISMLTGLTTPTSGDATLFGRSIRTDFDELRHFMGIYPQHDVLLADLTVEDHLLLFGTMKNVPPQRLADEVDKMIREVGLLEKRHAQVKELSGGQKRKLSMALAFIGGSKLVFLDEPTSGMDPYSRRFTWNLLQRHREGRVIVLTTHFMDEADVLGDRIAIMADGQLCCAGTSLFLKNRYGAGYNLTLIKDSATSPVSNVSKVTQFLQRFVAEAKCLSHHGSEMVFQLPSHSVAAFPDMLEALDVEMTRLHITQYGVSVTTMEEVFLRIARDREELRLKQESTRPLADTTAAPTSIQCGRPTFGSQLSALLTKRVRITKRDRKSLVNSLVIPVLLLLLAAIIPEIQVSSILPDHAPTVPSAAKAATCSLTRDSSSSSDINYAVPDATCASQFTFCQLGIFSCDATVCCDASNHASPFFRCNNCANPSIECYNAQCLSNDGAKTQMALNSFMRSTIFALAFGFIPAAIVAFVVREKDLTQNATMLQLICGAKPAAYWLANWMHDFVVMLLPIVVVVVLMPLTTRGLSSIQADEVAAILLLVLSHCLAVIPMSYVVSYRYKIHSSAQTSLLMVGVATGGLLSIISILCRLLYLPLSKQDLSQPDPSSVPFLLSTLDRSYLRWIYLLFPAYALNSGFYEIAMHRVSHTPLGEPTGVVPPTFFGAFPWLGAGNCSTECWDHARVGCCVRSVLALDVAGAPILYGFLEAAVFTVALYWLSRVGASWKVETQPAAQVDSGDVNDDGNAVAEDSDVAAERARVQVADPTDTDCAVVMRDLRQQYKSGKVALDDLCLAIPKGECFGYLGINGAGKSTTIKILTGQIAPSNCFAALGGYDLSRFRDEARTVLGYCPQFDSLHDLLTVEEQLELYARLKGIPPSQVADAVDQKIREVGLDEYRSNITRGLSGGNKRKVSTAIALMGAPRIIFLDEPSTGVDPSSRRKMWDVIAGVCAEKESCVVLTTHSMEECEALATRVGILVSGKLMCLGSVEHLKQKFGTGFTVEVKLRDPPEAAVDELVLRVTRAVELVDAKVTTNTLERVCEALGDPPKFAAITAREPRALVLTQLLTTDGSISVTTLCEWWLREDLASRLLTFFTDHLAGSELAEHKASEHFRFQVPKHALQPSAIFRLLEDAKGELHVGEYSVTDTRLEHIFNTMAAQQDEESLRSTDALDAKAIAKKAKTKKK